MKRKTAKTTKTSSSVDLRSHFGLHAIPFTREFSPQSRWRHPVLDEAVEELRLTVEQRMSAALVAPAGGGKTVILRALHQALPEARYRVHYVKITDLSKRDFCREVAVALGCTPAGHYGSLVDKIQGRCQTLLDEESLRPVILIDEAHDFRPDVLAIMRILTNFDMDSRLVVSIVLAGQPRLRNLLRRDDLEAVNRRIDHYSALRLFSREEIREYVLHRLDMAGAKNEFLDDGAHDALYESAQGNLRATDRLARKSLELAAANNDPVVGAEHVAHARQKVLP